MSYNYDPINDPDAPTGLEGWTIARLQAGDPNRGLGVFNFAGPSDLERNIQKELAKRKQSSRLASPASSRPASSSPASSSPAPSAPAAGPVPVAGPGWGDVSSLFREALASLTNEGEKSYQTGKRRTLADIAMQSVNSGMANTLNMPAAGIAYDEANRPAFNTRLGEQKAGILTGLGQTAAGMYGQNLGAQTSRYATDVGAQTSRYGTDVGAQTARYATDVGAQTSRSNAATAAGASLSNAAMGMQMSQANLDLNKYLGELNNATRNREMDLRAWGL